MLERIPNQANILEVGGGSGDLWAKNIDRIPSGWKIVFTDLTQGMVDKAKDSIGDDTRFSYQLLDASKAFPFEKSVFDVVIANHMLYHIDDVTALLAEIGRVLTGKGIVFASTLGNVFRDQIHEILVEFNLDYSPPVIRRSFNPANGHTMLSAIFPNVEFIKHQSGLVIHEKHIHLLVGYINSFDDLAVALKEKPVDEFTQFLRKKIQLAGPLEIAKEEGLFIGSNQ